jgi:hypothetical protein
MPRVRRPNTAAELSNRHCVASTDIAAPPATLAIAARTVLGRAG